MLCNYINEENVLDFDRDFFLSADLRTIVLNKAVIFVLSQQSFPTEPLFDLANTPDHTPAITGFFDKSGVPQNIELDFWGSIPVRARAPSFTGYTPADLRMRILYTPDVHRVLWTV